MSKDAGIIEIASVEAEQLVLGRMIQSKIDCKNCIEALSEEHFFGSENKVIFSAIQTLCREGKPAEIFLITNEIKAAKQLETVNVPGYLTTLAQLAPLSIHLDEYIQILKDHWAKRAALEEAQKISLDMQRASNIGDFLDKIAQKFAKISLNRSPSGTTTFAQVSRGEGEKSYLAKLAFRREYYKEHKQPFVDGVSSGYADLDRMIGGLVNSNLTILASRPGMGKTALALNFVDTVAEKVPVGFVSLEMTSEQLYERMISLRSEVSGHKIRSGICSEKEWQSIVKEESNVAALGLHIHEGYPHINDIVASVRRLKEGKGIQLLVIDYLQLMAAEGENRLLEISNITRRLKNLAVELHLPILCLSQLSRKVEERTNHRPLLSDLRESGSIEQDADVVLFLTRSDYYEKDSRQGEADLLIAKNRHGETGEIKLVFLNEIAKFEAFTSESVVEHERF